MSDMADVARMLERRYPARPPCSACGEAWYEHKDHAALAEQFGRCPFGDCGAYQAARTP